VDVVLTWATVSAGIRLALPVVLASLGALVGERAGVLNLGIEGLMLSGGLAGYLTTRWVGSPWVGLLGGLVVGAACGGLIALMVVWVRANQVVTGLAFTLLAASATTYIYQQSFDLGSQPPRIDRIAIPPLVVVAVVVLAIGWFVTSRTTAGLALSAAGETPEAVDALGYRVGRIRTLATVCGSALAGLGGAVLVCGPLGLFIQNVTAGRGWVALALVVFARWRPVPCVAGALLFGLCDAIQLRIQGTTTAIPYEIFLALPYVVTLLALVVRARDSRTPSALGAPFVRGAA
jgi:simple sugar transport system permease protein